MGDEPKIERPKSLKIDRVERQISGSCKHYSTGICKICSGNMPEKCSPDTSASLHQSNSSIPHQSKHHRHQTPSVQQPQELQNSSQRPLSSSPTVSTSELPKNSKRGGSS